MTNQVLIRGVAALGTARLTELGAQVGVAASAGDDAPRFAERLLAALEHPTDLTHRGLGEADIEVIGRALGLGARANWRPSISSEAYDRLPFYQKPSYDQDVWNAMLSTGDARPEMPAPETAQPRAAKPAATRKPKARAAKPAATRKPKARAAKAAAPKARAAKAAAPAKAAKPKATKPKVAKARAAKATVAKAKAAKPRAAKPQPMKRKR